ncbi:MarR family transcriptional regulator [Actinomadura sp. 7K534]|uniref:MarR family winged helix-turn-helix transcriptional regulator n=1 Tax=Actinomadura sp. 7K534 TaxID=2530366 RepID=UPI0010476C46|nr:MarR family transcriptional regulator [Actinomadura sp. 7K534]TDB96840.1 MarR family transcriptional regulator [Actinomadura sp. 7K534]
MRDEAGHERAGDDRAVDVVERSMVKLRRGMSRQRLGKAAVREHNLPVDVQVLHVVDVIDEGPDHDGQEMSVGLVAARLGVDASRGSRIVAEAVKAGYVRRVASQEDGRRIHLELTPAGQAVVDATRRTRHEHFAKAMAGWTDEERAEFARLLSRFVRTYDG